MSARIAAIKTRRFQIEELKPHPRNPREHPEPGDPEWDVLKRSLENLYFDPVIVNERNGLLVSGHLRVKVMREIGFTAADAVVIDCDEEVHWAIMVHANKPSGKFDLEILAALAKDIDAAGIEAALAGFDQKAFAELLAGPELDDDTASAEELLSKAEQLQGKWQVCLGDIFQIGAHRLHCGDCGSIDNWQKLHQGAPLDMFWIDPPYNVAQDSAQKHRQEWKHDRKGTTAATAPQALLNDELPTAEYEKKLREWFSAAFAVTKPGGVIYIAHAESYGLETRAAARSVGWKIAQALIWEKNAFTLGRQDYQWQHEPILYGWKPGAAHYWQGGYCQSTVINFERAELKKKSKAELLLIIDEIHNAKDGTVIREPRNVANEFHPTVKPLRMVARQIWNSSQRGETVGEQFGGSGTTLVAAEQTGRRCLAHELDPKYCAVILERLSTLGLSVEKINGAGY